MESEGYPRQHGEYEGSTCLGLVQVQGGPFPAITDSRGTSMGAAIERFLRPVCYQDMPTALVPEESSCRTQGFRAPPLAFSTITD
jgi:hypothetical protein